MNSSASVRRVLAAYFNVGDLITFGKYQNKKGRIVGFTTDEKGYPAVEIEPVPKDGKHNKTLTLFKIRKVPIEKQAMNLARRVVARYLQAFGGWTVVVGNIRIQRWQNAIRVWDLTNAGKRGKKVDSIHVWTKRHLPHEEESAFIGRLYEMLQNYDTLAEAKSGIEDYMDQYPDSLSLDKGQERGIDVQPAGTTSLRLTTSTGCKITATPLEWQIVNTVEFTGPRGNKFDQDTSYWNRGKKSAQLFYNWLLGNTDKISRMTIQDFQKLWSELGIDYDSH
jgi:hypothetical protein